MDAPRASGTRLGTRLLAGGTVVVLLGWGAAAAQWKRAHEAESFLLTAERGRTQLAGLEDRLRSELARRPEELDRAVDLALREAAVAQRLRLVERVRAVTPPPDLRALVRAELERLTPAAAWIREPDGEITWSAGGRPLVEDAGSPPLAGACELVGPEGEEAWLGACAERVVEAGLVDRFVAGAARRPQLAGLPGHWAVGAVGSEAGSEASSSGWDRIRLPGIPAPAPGGTHEEAVSLLGEPMTWRVRRPDDLPVVLQVLTPAAERLRWRALLAGDAGSRTRDWRRWLAVSGLLVSAGLSGLVLFSIRLARAFDPLLDAIPRVGAEVAWPRLPLERGDELGALSEALVEADRRIKEARRAVEREARIAAWRDVARSLAHEIKNPLMPIRGTIENLVRWRRDEPERFDRLFEQRCATILEEVDQLARLATSFSEFAKLPAPSPAPADLPGLVRQAAALQASAFPAVRIEDRLAEGLPPVEVDAGQVRQVVGNLVKNAAEALGPSGGTIRLESGAEPGGGAWLAVEDDGPGVPEELLARLFTPFFTTRAGGGGSGLGLFLCRRIVAEHGGRIEAARGATGGLRVTVHLPGRA